MASKDTTVTHDHAYCSGKSKEHEVVPSETGKQVETIELESSQRVSPTHSYDSGIDSFANDLTHGFGKENGELFSFLLDEQGFLNLDSDEDNSEMNSNDKAPKSVPKPPSLPSKPPSASTRKAARVTTDPAMKSSNKTTARGKPLVRLDREKNAENARENRRKKKEYVTGLEKEVGQLRTDKEVLATKLTELEKKANNLEDEVDYLKSVIENQTMLSKLLRNVTTTPGISLSTSFCSSRESASKNSGKENAVSTRSSRKRPCASQKETPSKQKEAPANKRSRRNGSSGGICLHVKQNKVSLEFCQRCSKISQD